MWRRLAGLGGRVEGLGRTCYAWLCPSLLLLLLGPVNVREHIQHPAPTLLAWLSLCLTLPLGLEKTGRGLM
jgi:prenyltransferase beta subunit